jgi:hypothetical protein
MDHPQNPRGKAAIARRLRLIRTEIYGEDGSPELASQLRLPFRTWVNYESGVTIPGEVLLSFLEATGTNPAWLLRGIGPKYMATTLGTSANASVD